MNISIFFVFEIFFFSSGISKVLDTYNAAVVELTPNTNPLLPAKTRLLINVQHYVRILEELSNSNKTLDIIVFPEYTIMNNDPLPETAAKIPPLYDVPLCNSTDASYADFLKEMSCLAVKYRTIIIINLTEKEKCHLDISRDCSKSQEVFYNTNIALAPNGTVLARYRKWNLFGEHGKSKPTVLDLPILKIRNTTFGIMTCFDIQFGVPALTLTRIKKVKNVIFPLNWISELPYLTDVMRKQSAPSLQSWYNLNKADEI